LAVVSASGYNLLTTGIDLLNAAENSPLCGIFNDDHLPYEFDGYTTEPHLHEMASAALKNLDTYTTDYIMQREDYF
jgi:alkaline phosphatase